jgi:hypothetical protein
MRLHHSCAQFASEYYVVLQGVANGALLCTPHILELAVTDTFLCAASFSLPLVDPV